MSNIGFWSYYEENCIKNKIFIEKDADIRENTFVKYNELYSTLNSMGHKINTLDMIENLNNVDLLIIADFPRKNSKYFNFILNSKIPKILILEECKLIRPNNWIKENHKIFDFILTNEDDWIDNIKYFKFNTNFIETKNINFNINHKIKDFVIINSNKSAIYKNELYSERLKVINWFNKNNPEKLDLWGRGWDRITFPSNIKYIDRLNSKKLDFLFKHNRPIRVWKGEVKIKKDVIKNYRFCFAFENFSDLNGYITEKIFDAFFASTIPIYWGAKNISTHIPENCYIDFRNFKNLEELICYTTTIDENEYKKYLINISKFLNSDKSYQFSSKYFIDQIISLI